MITLIAKEQFKCFIDNIVTALKNLDQIYTLYCPEEHVTCKFIKGSIYYSPLFT
jgi:hypothetical protein